MRSMPEEDILTVGMQAPSFPGSASFPGKNVVLYFYPKSGTHICKQEVAVFSREAAEFARLETELVGIDCQLADEELLNSYGVLKHKRWWRRGIWRVNRSSILIDTTGIIRRVWRNVKHVEQHVAEVKHAALVLQGLRYQQKLKSLPADGLIVPRCQS